MKKIYSKFTKNRTEKFQIETEIYDKDGEKIVVKRALYPSGQAHIDNMISNYNIYKENGRDCLVTAAKINNNIAFEFVEGDSLYDRLFDLYGKNPENFMLFINKYKELVYGLIVGDTVRFTNSEEFVKVFGKNNNIEGLIAARYLNIDLSFDNIILDKNDNIKIIDYEWIFDFPIPVDFVIYRAIYALYVRYFIGDSDIPKFEDCCFELGITNKMIESFERMNRYFNRYVCGEDVNYETILQQYKKESVSYTSLYPEKLLYAQLYVDYGNGFSEANSIIKNLSTSRYQKVDFEIPQIAKVEQIRLDLCNEKADTMITSLILVDEDGEKINYDIVYENYAFKENNVRVYKESDMQLVIKAEGDKSVKKVLVEYELVLTDYEINKISAELTDRNAREETTAVLNNEWQQKVDEFKQEAANELSEKDRQINEIAFQKQTYEALYNDISNSFYWKATKPLRKATDKSKDILKKNKVTYKLGKGVKCAKQHGLSYTIARANSKIRRRLNKNVTEVTNAFVSMEKNKEFTPIEENIKFSVLVPLYNTEVKYLKEMIDSVVSQTYTNWELCLADGSTEGHEDVQKVCEEYAWNDKRIKYQKLEENLGISENTNTCAKMATGEYIVLFDHDDLMNCMALYENARAIQAVDADVLYSDEDHVTETGEHVSPLFKPDWSRDLLYSQMYVCHLFVFKRALFEKIGGFRKEFDGSQDYDLMLRFSEETERIVHIPKLLYSWRETQTSTAKNADSKPYAHFAGLNALNDHLKRRYGDIAHAEQSEYTFVFEARFDLMSEDIKVSIIMPMKDHYELSKNCIDSILAKTKHQNYEIIILNNNSEKEETFKWFEEVVKQDSRIKVVDASFEFNWSKLNNFGMKQASGDVYVFLNNDIEVISEDWLDRLGENALRDDIGVVGPLLLFEDNTIQHAGIVVGIGGWADHIFRGQEPVHYGSPYISPMLNRNVSAVTGACMVISKKTIEKIGAFDESFLVCGSDVEICLRAYYKGLNNMYDARTRLYHLESKSRDASKVPEIDFKRSYECYTPFRENGDPFYNLNLDLSGTTPKEVADKSDILNNYDYLNNLRFVVGERITVSKLDPATIEAEQKETQVNRRKLGPEDMSIPEIQPIGARKTSYKRKRLNILSPSVDKKHVFGGIATAIKFYEALGKELGCDMRIIVTDAAVDVSNMIELFNYVVVDSSDDSDAKRQIVGFADRYNKTIPVGENDIFMATGWWTAYTIEEVIKWQAMTYNQNMKPLVYMIQDYEPGFYAWSSRYLMSESTYRLDVPTIAVVNSELLKEHLLSFGYEFASVYCFDPVLNEKLKEYVMENKDKYRRKKQILIYGRPSVARNAFELIITSLKEWAVKYKDAPKWTIVSAGEDFEDFELVNGIMVKSVGKLSLEEYGKMMLETSIGISLMVSPHPSYPPLEMSTFGVRTITNCYGGKDLRAFNNNIISLKNCSSSEICKRLSSLCDSYSEKGNVILNEDYVGSSDPFGGVIEELAKEL